MKPELMFTYGTLKRGYGNYERLLRDSKFLGSAMSFGKYRMYDIGFPCLLEDSKGHEVLGDIFEVEPDVLARCDRLEGHPDMYCRRQRKFELRKFAGRGYAAKIAWVYIYQWPQRFAHAEELRIHPNVKGLLEWNRVLRGEGKDNEVLSDGSV